jgi:hypothetical protein
LLNQTKIDSGSPLIYPNPFSDKIYLKGIQATKVEITDISGRKYPINSPNPHCIDLGYLDRGVYIISIFTGNDKFTQRIIKK